MDDREMEDLIVSLHKVANTLLCKGSRVQARVVDTAATRIRLLLDDVQELAAELAETHERLRRVEQDRENLRDDYYYMSDRFEEARDEAQVEGERADELQLRLDEARAIEAGLRADLAGMSEHHWTKGHE